MKIDCYGYRETSRDYFKRVKKASDIAETTDCIYVKFSAENIGPIHKITSGTDGTTSIRWAYGDWENRTSIEYTATLNDYIEIEAEV